MEKGTSPDVSTGVSARWRYGFAALCVLAAAAVRLALDPLLGEAEPILGFVLAITVAAWLWGRKPGLAATGLSVPLAWFFFIPPRFAASFTDPRAVGRLLLLAAAGAGISLLIGTTERQPGAGRRARLRVFDAAFMRRVAMLGGVFVLLAVFSRLLYSDYEREKDQQAVVMRAHDVAEANRVLQASLQSAQTAQRSYLVTGDARYLASFEAARTKGGSQLQELRKINADDSAASGRIAGLEAVLNARFSELQRAISLRQEKGPAAASAVVNADEDQRAFAEFRAALSAVAQTESQRAARQIGSASEQGVRTRWVLGLGSGGLLMLLAFAGAVIERDIRKRERLVGELSLGQQRLNCALETGQGGAWDLDLSDGSAWWSPEMYRLWGVPADTPMTTESSLACVDERDRQALASTLNASIRDRRQYRYEFRVNHPELGERWMESAGSTSYAGDKAAGMVGITLDVTSRKRAEMEIRQLNAQLEDRVRQRTAQLEASNKELEAFAYSVSHDLRAPLRGIDGWSLALMEDYAGRLDEQALLYLGRVRAEAQRMGELIDDMLQLSRVSRSEMKYAPVDLSAMARSVAAGLAESAARRVEFIIEPGLGASGDARLLEIALTNLLGNAVKFTGKRPEARVEFGRSLASGEPAFYVRDNGVGFDMAYAGTLFGAFQRLHKSSEFPGSGIGLATVQRIIHRHGGRVWAEAAVNQGATFYFTLGEAS
jgi:signal transduction histidine kinase